MNNLILNKEKWHPESEMGKLIVAFETAHKNQDALALKVVLSKIKKLGYNVVPTQIEDSENNVTISTSIEQ